MQCWEWRGCGSSDPGITVKPMMGEQPSQTPRLMAIQEALRLVMNHQGMTFRHSNQIQGRDLF